MWSDIPAILKALTIAVVSFPYEEMPAGGRGQSFLIGV